MLRNKRILLVISGGIAAYKSLELIRLLRERGASVRCVMTEAACEFVTPLSVSALSEDKAYCDLFSLTDESEMGHIRLSREADLLVVAPATANILAKMAGGICDDLASTVLLATDKDVLAAPAMNVRMWTHPATTANVSRLRNHGVRFTGPTEGPMACGEFGEGRMAEPDQIVAEIERYFGRSGLLAGRQAIVTSGPTHEAIDPVRYIANRSSGKQGHAIAAAISQCGADTLLVTGPSLEPDPAGVKVVHIESAREMHDACVAHLPVDVAVCAAAVADWRPAHDQPQKIKKTSGNPLSQLELTENPDILAAIAGAGEKRPKLVIGFAAETEDIVAHATEKLARKGCDWMLANDVSCGTDTFGGDFNEVHLVSKNGVENWPAMSKSGVADQLASRICDALSLGQDAAE